MCVCTIVKRGEGSRKGAISSSLLLKPLQKEFRVTLTQGARKWSWAAITANYCCLKSIPCCSKLELGDLSSIHAGKERVCFSHSYRRMHFTEKSPFLSVTLFMAQSERGNNRGLASKGMPHRNATYPANFAFISGP